MDLKFFSERIIHQQLFIKVRLVPKFMIFKNREFSALPADSSNEDEGDINFSNFIILALTFRTRCP